jgi:hypothetical protein
MKTKDVDALASIVKTLCRELEEPWAIGRFHYLMIGLVELAREGKAWKALDVAFETNAFLCEMAERAEKEQKARERTEQLRNDIAAHPWSTPDDIKIRTTQPSFTGYVQLRPEAPKPVATVEQMRAAADAAMAADQELVEWDCSVCHKKTLTDDFMPVGWARTLNSNTGDVQYTCVECQMFGIKVPKKERQYQCMGCDAETTSIAFPPPGWKEVEDGEVICFGCAEADAEAGDV